MLNQITTLRLPDGREVAFVDWSDMPLYSTLELLGNFVDNEITCFTYTIGDPVPATLNAIVQRTATERDTNVVTPGSMASTEELLVYAIKPEYMLLRTTDQGDTDLTTATVLGSTMALPVPQTMSLGEALRRLVLQLEVSQKIEHQAPLSYYNTGFGGTAHWGVNDDTDATPNRRGYATAGSPRESAVRSLAIPVHIGGQENYRVRLVNPTGLIVNFRQDTNAIDDQLVYRIRVLLDGLYKRPVS